MPAKFKVGLIAFSSNAQVLAPPSTDRQSVREAIDSLTANGGTAVRSTIVPMRHANPSRKIVTTVIEAISAARCRRE